MNLLRVLATISGMTMLSRITGLIREMLTAGLFAASGAADAYYVAFRIPNLLRRLFAEGAFSQAFVPILGEFKARKGDIETKSLIDDTVTVLFWALLVTTVAGVVASPALVWVFASGMTGADFTTAVLLTRVMFPYILLISLVSAASGVLNTWRKFAVPAFTPVLLNLSFIACAVLLMPHVNPPVLALGIGVTLGGIAQLLFQVPALIRIGMLPNIALLPMRAFRDPGVRLVLRRMIPAAMAVSVAQLSLIINTNIATHLGTGSVAWISYADRLMEFPTALLGAALATILTPSLSHARATDNDVLYGELLDWGMRLAFLLALPSALALWMIATPLTATLFQHGAFSAHDVFKTQQAVMAYGLGLIGLILIKILAPGFYARQDVRTPVKIGVCVLVATQLMNLVFVPLFDQAGLTLSISVGAIVNALLLYVGLRRRGAIRLQPGWRLFCGRIVVALAVMSVVLYWADHQYDWIGMRSHPWLRMALLGMVILIASGAYFATLFVSGMRVAEFKRRI